MSIGAECGWSCKHFGGGNMLKEAVASAQISRVIVVAAADNDGRDISQIDEYPCALNGAICVGAIGCNFGNGNPCDVTVGTGLSGAIYTAANYSNYGSVVDTWAPAGIRTTLLPTSQGQPALFSGTSCAAPVVAGIVTLMKMLDHSLYYDQVRSILWNTANPSTDPKIAPTGYVDAYRAVAAVKANAPPTVTITHPVAGIAGYEDLDFIAQVKDPETPSQGWGTVDFSSKLVFSSNIDGELCATAADATGNGATLICTASRNLSIDTHVITATATDPFGATGTHSVTIAVVNTPPTPKITFPPSGATYYTSQKINLRGAAYDPDEEIIVNKDHLWTWTSSLSGLLSEWGNNVWVTLPPGEHTITLTVADSLGATGSTSVVVNVQVAGTGYPTAQILKPNNNTFEKDKAVLFEGSGIDPEDGDLPDTSFVWSSNKDGVLGTGKSFSIVLSGVKCSTIEHRITLEVTDSNGNKASHSILVYVMDPC